MANGNVYYVNSPVNGTHYGAPGGFWGIPANGTSWQVQVKAYAGANGTGGLVVCGSLTAMGSIQGGAQQGTFTGSNANTTSCTCSSLNGSQVAQPWGWWATSGSPGSLGIEIINMTLGAWYIPSISSLSPGNGGVGTTVTINGTNFHDYTSVDFNGVAASSVTFVSDTQLTAVVPSGATTGPVHVVNQNGSGASPSNFIVAQGYVNTGTPASPVWTPGPTYVNTGTPASPVWTAAQEAAVNTGTPASPVWTPGA